TGANGRGSYSSYPLIATPSYSGCHRPPAHEQAAGVHCGALNAISYSWAWPVRSEVKTTRDPSGEKRGCGCVCWRASTATGPSLYGNGPPQCAPSDVAALAQRNCGSPPSG